MNEQRRHSCNLSGLLRAYQRISQQRCAEAGLMVVLMDREAPQDHDGYGVGPVAPQGTRRLGMSDGSRRQAVVADNGPVLADYVGTRRAASLIGRGSALQPIVKRGLSALERIKDMMTGQSLRRRYHFGISQGALAFSSLRRRSVGAGGLSSIARKAAIFSASSEK